MTEDETTGKPDKRRRPNAWSLAMARQFEAALGGDCPVVLAGPLIEGSEILPLRIGMFEELLAAYPDADAAALKAALGRYCRNLAYHEAVRDGEWRHDRHGKRVAELSAGERKNAATSFEAVLRKIRERKAAAAAAEAGSSAT